MLTNHRVKVNDEKTFIHKAIVKINKGYDDSFNVFRYVINFPPGHTGNSVSIKKYGNATKIECF